MITSAMKVATLILGALVALSYAQVDGPQEDKYILHTACVSAIQEQINTELYASLVYAQMAAHFDNPNVARKGFAKFFKDSSDEEKTHAHAFIDYINKRGGRVTSFNVQNPPKDSWDSAKEALEDAVALEKDVHNKIYRLHGIAEHQCRDPHLMDFLETPFLEEQVQSIGQLNRLISIIREMDNGMGEYLLDRQILRGETKSDDL